MKLLNNFKKEKGAVLVVEASFIFPIIFFVLIILLYMGNMLYQQTKMDSIAIRGAEYLAAIYTNPILAEDAIPQKSTDVNVKPYRYLLGDSDAENKTRKFIDGLIEDTGTGFFKGMEIDATIKTCKIKNYVIYQTACVEIEYSINVIPIRFFDKSEVMKTSTATIVTAVDSAEFIRNVDMILDYSEEFGLTDKIQEFVGAFK